MQLERVLIVVKQRSIPDGSYPDFDIRQMEGTLRFTRMANNIDVLYSNEYKPNCDEALINYCIEKKPQVVLLCLQGMGWRKRNPTTDALWKITHQLHIPTVVFWFDIHSDEYADLLVSYLPSVTLNLIGGADASRHKPMPLEGTNYVYSSLAYDESYFNKPEVERDIPVGFLGTVKGNRRTWIDGLKENGIDVFISGGQMTPQWMDFSTYCELTKRFKIAINFSALGGGAEHQLSTWIKSLAKHPGNILNKKQLVSALKPVVPPSRYQISSRVWEVLWLRTFLLEEDNHITSLFFEPYVDYVPYSTLNDLVDKIRYYLENEEERDRIRMHGRATVEKYYNARIYFENIFEVIGISPNKQFHHHPGEIWNKAHFENWISGDSSIERNMREL